MFLLRRLTCKNLTMLVIVFPNFDFRTRYTVSTCIIVSPRVLSQAFNLLNSKY